MPVEVKYKDYWAIKNINESSKEVSLNRRLQPNKLKEIRNEAFENAKLSKLHMKKLHDQHINRKNFYTC